MFLITIYAFISCINTINKTGHRVVKICNRGGTKKFGSSRQAAPNGFAASCARVQIAYIIKLRRLPPQNLFRVKTVQNCLISNKILFILSLICHRFSVSAVSCVAKVDFKIFAVDKMSPNGSWNLNPMASYPLYGQPNSVRRWNVHPLYDDQFGYPHVPGRRFENGTIFWTRQLPSDDSVDTIWMRMQQTRQKLSRQNLSLDFSTDNCDFVF